MRLALISILLASSAALAQYTPYTNTLNGRQFTTPMNDALVETPAFKTMTAARRTALYDACLITGGLMAGIASNANESGNAEEKALARQMATDTLALFGIK